jgi:hypothetical protein
MLAMLTGQLDWCNQHICSNISAASLRERWEVMSNQVVEMVVMVIQDQYTVY